MTQAKAQSVVSSLIGQGYLIDEVGVRPGGQWYVIAYSSTGPIDTGTIQTFATNNAISASTDRAILI